MLCLSFPSYRFIINWFKKINWNTHSLSRSHCPPFFPIFYSTQFIDLWAGGLSSKIIRRQFSVVFHSGRRSHLATVRIMEKSLSLSPTGSRCHVLYICNWRTQLIFFLGHKPKMEKLVLFDKSDTPGENVLYVQGTFKYKHMSMLFCLLLWVVFLEDAVGE